MGALGHDPALHCGLPLPDIVVLSELNFGRALLLIHFLISASDQVLLWCMISFPLGQ